MSDTIYKTILEKRERARQLRAFRPSNMTEGELMLSPDLEYVGGEFSTFDSELSRLMNIESNADAAREHMKKQLSGSGATPMNKISMEIACQVFDCVYENQKLALRAVAADVNGDINAWNNLFETVIDKLDVIYKPRKIGRFLDVMVVDSWADIGLNIEENRTLCAKLLPRPDNVIENAVHYDLVINRKIVNRILVKKSTDPIKMLIEMVKSFSHEYKHFLDLSMPNRGALGEQFVAAAAKMYSGDITDYNKYRDNALEISAFQTEKMLCILDRSEKQ